MSEKLALYKIIGEAIERASLGNSDQTRAAELAAVAFRAGVAAYTETGEVAGSNPATPPVVEYGIACTCKACAGSSAASQIDVKKSLASSEDFLGIDPRLIVPSISVEAIRESRRRELKKRQSSSPGRTVAIAAPPLLKRIGGRLQKVFRGLGAFR